MKRLRTLRIMVGDGLRGFGAWQAEIPDQGRVVLAGLLLLAAAFLAAGFMPFALGIPAGVLLAVGLGVDFRDRHTAIVLIGAVAIVAVAVVVGGR